MSDNVNVNSQNKYTEHNQDSQFNQFFLSCLQSAYHSESIFIEHSDEDYTEEEYADEYNYDYKKDIYYKKNFKKNSESTVDVTAFTLNTFNEEIYHINIFHAYIITTNYVCCMCKTVCTLNNKLHHYIHLTHSKIKKKIKTKKTKILSSEQELKNISIAIHMNLIFIKNINSIATDINVDHINIVESDIKNQINESDCEFCN